MKLAAGIRRHYRKAHRFVVFSDKFLPVGESIEVLPITDPALAARGCFCRLRMFDPIWQQQHDLGDRIVNLDLDVVVVRPIFDLFERPESFVILGGINAVNPNPFNCSVMMLRAGCHAEVWSDFTIEKACDVPFHEFPDDQGWIWHKLPKAAVWRGGRASGIYGFEKPGWPVGRSLPPDARIVAFIGWRKPSLFVGHPWVRMHWRLEI